MDLGTFDLRSATFYYGKTNSCPKSPFVKKMKIQWFLDLFWHLFGITLHSFSVADFGTIVLMVFVNALMTLLQKWTPGVASFGIRVRYLFDPVPQVCL